MNDSISDLINSQWFPIVLIGLIVWLFLFIMVLWMVSIARADIDLVYLTAPIIYICMYVYDR